MPFYIVCSEPLYEYQNGTEVRIWNMISNAQKLEFLQIDNEVKMIPEPFPRRVAFWENLDIDDRYSYERA
jgi:hypothetical protein